MIQDFLDMGGYAAYIWPAYAVVLVVLGALLIVSLKGTRDRERELKGLEERLGGRRQRRSRGASEGVKDDA